MPQLWNSWGRRSEFGRRSCGLRQGYTWETAAPQDPRPSTHHVQDRLSSVSCLLSGTLSHWQAHLPSSSLWLPPPPPHSCTGKSDSGCQHYGCSLECFRVLHLPVPILPVSGNAVTTQMMALVKIWSLLSLSLTMPYAWVTPSRVTPLQVPCLVAVYALSRISPPWFRVTPTPAPPHSPT